jgi:serine/threonine-protein kinase
VIDALDVARTERTSSVGSRATRRGEVLAGTYRLLERIGAGGMGEVYAAEHARLGRRVAVKILRPDDHQAALDRFRREVKAIARLESEYVVNVMDCGEADDGTPFLVMDLLHGEDLRCLLKREVQLPIARAVNLILDACHGVAAVHDAGLVHRDLKPGNLFVTRRSTGEDWCKILDFGVAKIDTSTWTAEGAVIGTIRYMAPEQLRDGASAGPSVDIYALAAILYECLSGTSPYTSTSVEELMFKVMNETPTPIEELNPRVPAPLSEAVQRAMAKSPNERFTTIQGFARAIAPFGCAHPRGEIAAGVETLAFEKAEPRRSQAWRKPVAAFFAGLLLGSGVWALRPAARLNGAASVALVPRILPAQTQSPSTSSPSSSPISNRLNSVAAAEAQVVTAPSPSASAPNAPRKKAPGAARPSLSLANARFDADNPYLH